MFSYYSILVYGLVVATAVMTIVSAALRRPGARRPLTIVLVVLGVALLASLFVQGGLLLAVPIVVGLLFVTFIVQFVVDPAARRSPLVIVAAVLAVLTLLSMWPIVGMSMA